MEKRVPIKRGKTEEAIEHYYFLLEIRAEKDFDLSHKASYLDRWRPGDHPNYIKFCEYGRRGFEAAAAVVRPLNLVYNFIIRYQRNHTPWESFPLPTENHPVLGPYEVYRCLQEISRENLELILKHFQLTNRQRDALLSSITYGKPDDFVDVYGEMSNDQEVSNLCWELGLYHPEEDALVQSRLLEDPDIYYEYKEGTRMEDWAEIESGPITNIDVLNRVQYFYEVYCEGRKHLIEDDDIINKREKELINEVLMRPEGDIFRNAYESGKSHLIEYDANTLEVVSIEDYTLTSCPPFDDIDWLDIEGLGVQLIDQIPDGEGEPKVHPSINTDIGKTQNKPSAGREPETWCIKPWTEETFGQRIKSMVWPYLREELREYNYGIDKQTSKNQFEKAVRSSAAALVVYCSEKIGLSVISPVKTVSKSMERTFSFLPAPRTTTGLYLKRLSTWYEKVQDLTHKQVQSDEKVKKILEKWKQEDRTRAYFIIDNASKLKKMINNNLPYLLAEVFSIETDIKYTETNAAYDKALYKAAEYNDKVKKNEDGHKQKTDMGMSDCSDKD